jgi:hypothetical protein
MCAAFFESLEGRWLFSVAVSPTAAGFKPAGQLPAITASSTILLGRAVNAEAGQEFRAVLGTIRGLKSLPKGYVLAGQINWGDGAGTSLAQFVRQADGTIAVLGDHTYAAVGTDDVTVAVTAVPPVGSLAAVRVIGTLRGKANVISSAGGVTVEETAGAAFTANVGFFSSALSSLTMTAVIRWGDGTLSAGRIEALPSAVGGPNFAVVGSHTYVGTGSYLVHVTVYSPRPTPVARPTAAAAVMVVAQIDSVVDVLPQG